MIMVILMVIYPHDYVHYVVSDVVDVDRTSVADPDEASDVEIFGQGRPATGHGVGSPNK